MKISDAVKVVGDNGRDKILRDDLCMMADLFDDAGHPDVAADMRKGSYAFVFLMDYPTVQKSTEEYATGRMHRVCCDGEWVYVSVFW